MHLATSNHVTNTLPKFAWLLFAALAFLVGCEHAVKETPEDHSKAERIAPLDFAQRLRPRYVLGDADPRYRLADRMAHYKVPGVAVAIIDSGEIVFAGGFGVLQAGKDEPVDAGTVFSVGSVSKIATAAIALKMQAAGALDVDKDVSPYLSSWRLPASAFAPQDTVTLRMILSHTAGFNVHGFGDFMPGQDLPTVIETLTGEAPARNDSLELLFQPGAGFKYSGGGYTLAQLLLSDVAGTDFVDTAEKQLLAPLSMSRSSFANPLPETHGNIAKAHDADGRAIALPRGYEAMPEMAASGLWTSATDLGRLIAALIDSYRTGDGFLPQAIAIDMMTSVSPSQHGLGPRLEGTGSSFMFHHAGTNNSYRAWIEGHLFTGDGLVVLTNGAQGDDLYPEIRNAVADSMGWKINAPVVVPDLRLPVAHLQTFIGLYRLNPEFPDQLRQQLVSLDGDMAIELEGEQLKLKPVGGSRVFPLIPLAPNRFLVSGLDQRVGVAELIAHRNALGRPTGLTLQFENAQTYFDAVDAPTMQ